MLVPPVRGTWMKRKRWDSETSIPGYRSPVGLPLVLAAVAGFSGPGVPVQTQSWIFTDLGSLHPNQNASASADINNSGEVCGTSTVPAPPGFQAFHAFFWDPAGIVDIPPLRPHLAFGRALGDDGTVYGYSLSSGTALHAFRFDGVATHDLHPPGARNYSCINDISETGILAGVANVDPPPGVTVAPYMGYLQQGGATLFLPALGGIESHARAVNNLGNAAGYAEDATGAMQACIWFQGVPFGLGGFGGNSSHGWAMNNQDQVVGVATDSLLTNQPFFWDGTSLVQLSTLGGSSGWARDINDAGQIVGMTLDSSGEEHATLWEGGVPINLDAFAPAWGDWRLTKASGINELGEICGTGTRGNIGRAWKLTPSDRLRLSPMLPGEAGAMNRVDILGATIGGTLVLAHGTRPGSWPIPGLPGLFLDMADPAPAAVFTGSQGRRNRHELFIPTTARGARVLLQAVDFASGQKSELVDLVLR